MSVKLRPLLREPLLLVVDNEPRLELELTDRVDADSVFSCDSSCVIDRSASLSCCSRSCFSSCNLNLQNAQVPFLYFDSVPLTFLTTPPPSLPKFKRCRLLALSLHYFWKTLYIYNCRTSVCSLTCQWSLCWTFQARCSDPVRVSWSPPECRPFPGDSSNGALYP